MKILLVIALVGLGYLGFRLWFNNQHIPAQGTLAPPFKLNDEKNISHQLSDYRGYWLVLYFYPKNNTPSCTKEACHFRDDFSKLDQLGAKVLGVSIDDSSSHAEFSNKYHLTFPLLTDIEGKVAASYGALINLGFIKLSKRYTFLISPDGKIAKIYLEVNTSKHSSEVLSDLHTLSRLN